MGSLEGRGKWFVLVGFGLFVAAVVLAFMIAGPEEELEERTVAVPGCEHVEAPEPKGVSFQGPARVVTGNRELTAVVETSCGAFEVTLAREEAPRTVNSFVFLAEEGFYDGLSFHRVVPGFVVQGGDPHGDGLGGPGYHVEEKPPNDIEYTKGVVAMAKSPIEPPGRSGSQFFVVLEAAAPLPAEYALLGQVTEGFEVVERIGRLGSKAAEEPRRPVLIEDVRIERS